MQLELTTEQAVALEMLIASVLEDCPEHPHAKLLRSVLDQLPKTAPATAS